MNYRSIVFFVCFDLYFAEKCPKPNQEFQKCGSPCPFTCAKRQVQNCEYKCVPGCFCKPGYLRTIKGDCVVPANCPNSKPSDKCSGPNEVFDQCGTSCPLTCKNIYNRPKVCRKNCNPGCFCEPGYLRDDHGKCVTIFDCPNKDCKDPNEQYVNCGDACQITCQNRHDPPRWCLNKMCVVGCICKIDFVRNHDGKCVSVGQCKH